MENGKRLIDAKLLIDRIEDDAWTGGLGYEAQQLLMKIIKIIENQPEVVFPGYTQRGYWMLDDSNEDGVSYHCNQCGGVVRCGYITLSDGQQELQHPPRYCSKCGALNCCSHSSTAEDVEERKSK